VSCQLPCYLQPLRTVEVVVLHRRRRGRVRFAGVGAQPLEGDVDGFHEVGVVDGLGLLERIGKLLAVDGNDLRPALRLSVDTQFQIAQKTGVVAKEADLRRAWRRQVASTRRREKRVPRMIAKPSTASRLGSGYRAFGSGGESISRDVFASAVSLKPLSPQDSFLL
jgi:hypothetical protein